MKNTKILKRAYKEMDIPCGIYRIYNKTNGKMLIGQSMNLTGILNRHRFLLRMGVHSNKPLQQDWQTYGEENFEFEVLDPLDAAELSTQEKIDDLNALEDIWLEKLNPYEPEGYTPRKSRI